MSTVRALGESALRYIDGITSTDSGNISLSRRTFAGTVEHITLVKVNGSLDNAGYPDGERTTRSRESRRSGAAAIDQSQHRASGREGGICQAQS